MMSKDKPLTEVNLVRWIKLVATICLLIPATPSKSESGTDELSAAQGLPAVTQANRVLTAREAYAKWQAESRKPIILDVRTPEEFLFVGHAEMAWNVPVAAQSYIWDSATGQFPMRSLPDTNSVFRGQRMVNGWKNSGLPWTYDVDPKRMVLPPNPGQ
jgi:hypothetical protein